jgi:hypothetical protein
MYLETSVLIGMVFGLVAALMAFLIFYDEDQKRLALGGCGKNP